MHRKYWSCTTAPRPNRSIGVADSPGLRRAGRGGMDDEELIAGCLAGETRAWTELRTRVQRLAAAWANRLHLPPSAIEDVTQATLQEITANGLLARFRRESSLATYLGVVVRNVALRSLRGQPPVSHLSGDQPDPRDPYAAVETDEALEHLPPDEFIVLQLDHAGYSGAEIADSLSRLEGKPVTAAAVRKRLERARRALRRQTQRYKEHGP